MVDLNSLLAAARQLSGVVGVAIVDLNSGVCLGQEGGDSFDLSRATAGNTEVIRTKMRLLKELGVSEQIEDILITQGKQYHVLRPIHSRGTTNLCFCIALDREVPNLALTRYKLSEIERGLVL